MASGENKIILKKKLTGKWRKRANLTGLGNREKGFAQLRRTKAIQDYKKLLRRTKSEHATSSYAQDVYNSSLEIDLTPKSTLTIEDDKKLYLGEGDSAKQAPVGVVENTKNGQNKKNIKKELIDYSEKAKPSQNAITKPGDVNASRRPDNKKRSHKSRFTEAQNQYKKKKFDWEKKRMEKEEMKEKKIKELAQSLEKRRQTFHQLNKRTRRGQPVMSNQINHLLAKLQADK